MYKWADGREMRMDIQWESSLCHTCTLGYAQGTNILLGDPSWHKDRSDVPLPQHKCPDQHAVTIYGSRLQFGNKNGTWLVFSWKVLNLHHALLSSNCRTLPKALHSPLRTYSEWRQPCQFWMCGSSDVPDEWNQTSHFDKINLLRQRKATVALLPMPLWFHVWQKGLKMGTQHWAFTPPSPQHYWCSGQKTEKWMFAFCCNLNIKSGKKNSQDWSVSAFSNM